MLRRIEGDEIGRDPGEQNDLSADDSHILGPMRQKLLAWEEERIEVWRDAGTEGKLPDAETMLRIRSLGYVD